VRSSKVYSFESKLEFLDLEKIKKF